MQAVRIDERRVLERFEAKTPRSGRLFREAAKVTPGGVMGGIKFFDPYPIFMRRGEGSHLWDVDGNEYIDYLMSYGALALGHGEGTVRGAVEEALGAFGTTVLGTPTELEAEYGGLLRDIYHPGGLIRFTNSGLEATLLATRTARASRQRRRVAKFEGHYHGAVDRLLFSYAPGLDGTGPQDSPVAVGDSADVDGSMIEDSLVLPFNDLEKTEALLERHADELACVIMEPFEEGVIPAEKGFMEGLRGRTKELGIPLIFDEVKTGFRVRVGGATEYYSVTPDLACLGKVIGGGLPIGAVVGGPELMGRLDPREDKGTRVFHSGTFNGNPLSLSVGMATVRALKAEGRFAALTKRTEELKRGLAAVLNDHHIQSVFEGEGAMFNYYLTNRPVRNYRDTMRADRRMRRFIDLELISNGVYLKPEGRFCLSLSHSEEDVKSTAERFTRGLDSLLRPAKN